MIEKCKLCGSKDLRFVEEIMYEHKMGLKQIIIKKCNACGSKLLLNNLMKYDLKYYDHCSNETYENSGVHHNKNLIKEVVKLGTFLDVGCGIGNMLRTMHDDGFEVFGFDVINVLKPEVTKEISLKIGKNLFDWKTTKCFDVIQMREVIEHLINPVKYLVWCHNHLRRGGWLFIQTPTADNDDHVGRYAPGHLWLASQQGLKTKLEELGFRKVSLVCLDEGCMVLRCKK